MAEGPSFRPVPFITVDSNGAFQVGNLLALSLVVCEGRSRNNSATINRWQVHDEAAAIIRQIRGPLAVVAVAGLYRTGKSYLLNVLTDTIGQGSKIQRLVVDLRLARGCV